MKFSPNGKKIALANLRQQLLFDFDANTGMVSNAIILWDISNEDNDENVLWR